jgi:exopolysaccharide production protein ExoQ
MSSNVLTPELPGYKSRTFLKAESRSRRSWLARILLILVFLLFSAQGTFSFEAGQHTNESEKIGVLSGAEQGESHVLIGQASNFVWCLIALALISTRLRPITKLAAQSWLLSSLSLLVVLSALWSQSPELSFRRGGFLLLSTLLAYYFVAEYEPEEQVRVLMIVGALAAAASIATSLLLPQYGVDHMVHAGDWQGIFTQKNVCASAMLLFLVPLFSSMRATRRAFAIPYALMLLLVLGMTQSRSGWLVGVGVVALMLGVQQVAHFRSKDRSFLWGIVLSLLAATAWLLASFSTSLLTMLGRDTTLSGRTQIWEAVLHAIADHPILGYGYAAFWNGLEGASANIILLLGWAVPHAHNGLLDVCLQIGLLGAVLFLLSLILAVRDMFLCLRPGHPAYVDWYIATIATVVFFSVSEPFLLQDRSLSWVLYIAACIGLRRAAQTRSVRGGRIAAV